MGQLSDPTMQMTLLAPQEAERIRTSDLQSIPIRFHRLQDFPALT
jgi:hypothetical protein